MSKFINTHPPKQAMTLVPKTLQLHALHKGGGPLAAAALPAKNGDIGGAADAGNDDEAETAALEA